MTGGTSTSDACGCVSVPDGSSPSIARHASSGMTGGDPHHRRPFERRAVRVEGRPVHHGIAGAAMPGGVPAATVSEARLMADENPAGAELVSVRASCRRPRDPRSCRRADQVADGWFHCWRASRTIFSTSASFGVAPMFLSWSLTLSMPSASDPSAGIWIPAENFSARSCSRFFMPASLISKSATLCHIATRQWQWVPER